MWPDIDGGDLNFPGLHIMGYLRQGPKWFAREEVTVRKQKRKVLGPAYSTYHGRVRIPMLVSPNAPVSLGKGICMDSGCPGHVVLGAPESLVSENANRIRKFRIS